MDEVSGLEQLESIINFEKLTEWTSSNVIPAKIALGVMFAILGVLVLPGLGAWLAELVGRAV